jgi:hypothetical protein
MRKSTERFSKLALSFERFVVHRFSRATEHESSSIRVSLVRSEVNRADHCFFRWRLRHFSITIKRSGNEKRF